MAYGILAIADACITTTGVVVECTHQAGPDRIGTVPAAIAAVLTALALVMTVLVFVRDRTHAGRAQAEQVYAWQTVKRDTGGVEVTVTNRSKLPVYDIGVRLRDDSGFVNAPLAYKDYGPTDDHKAGLEHSEGQNASGDAATEEAASDPVDVAPEPDASPEGEPAAASSAGRRRQEGDNLLHGEATTGPWAWTFVVEDAQTLTAHARIAISSCV